MRRKTIFLLALWLLVVPGVPAGIAQNFQIVQQKGTDLIQVSAPKSGSHKLEIDDAIGFRTPVAIRAFNGSSFAFHGNDVGLIPGVGYHARLDGDPHIQDFRLAPGSAFTEPEVSCAMLRTTWEETGRLKTGVAFSGVRWDGPTSRWVLVPHSYLVGQELYYAGMFLRTAVTAARACDDLRTLDEVAQYYLIMLQQTESVGVLLNRPNVLQETKERMAAVDQSARSFATSFGNSVGDGELHISQWLYPAAKLVRLISLLPAEQRTSAMKTFAAQYTKFIVVEQLNRYLVQQRLPAPGGGPPVARIELWRLALRGLKGTKPWDTAMSDIDLWLLAAAAEMLGANANDPVLAPLDAKQDAMLRLAMPTGIQFFQSKRTDYPDTKNFQGERVGSASYFNGDYTAHPDYDYSAVTGEKFPSPDQRRTLPDASWDSMHVYRLPVFLRALYENRKATRSEFPQYRDLQMVANQYVYRVFNGDYGRPLFHNYFDGSDGWHRVGFHGSEFGYPPSPYCDMRTQTHPCMTPGQIIGWGVLAFASPDLATVEQALVKLAFDPKPEARQFRDRYYYFGQTPYEVLSAEGKRTYAVALYYVVADNAEMIVNQARLNP